MAKVPTPKRGEIWLIDFDPAVGAEMRKIRPAVVLNVDEIGRLPPKIVVPITDGNLITAVIRGSKNLYPVQRMVSSKCQGLTHFKSSHLHQTDLCGCLAAFPMRK